MRKLCCKHRRQSQHSAHFARLDLVYRLGFVIFDRLDLVSCLGFVIFQRFFSTKPFVAAHFGV